MKGAAIARTKRERMIEKEWSQAMVTEGQCKEWGLAVEAAAGKRKGGKKRGEEKRDKG